MARDISALEYVWIESVFAFATGLQTGPQIPLQVENQGAIKMAKIDASRNRTKHIDFKNHLV